MDPTKLYAVATHVEAGLRPVEKSMPEEKNRMLTNRVSDLPFCLTATPMENLSNIGNKKNLKDIMELPSQNSKRVVFWVHPKMLQKIKGHGITPFDLSISLIKPLGYRNLNKLAGQTHIKEFVAFWHHQFVRKRLNQYKRAGVRAL